MSILLRKYYQKCLKGKIRGESSFLKEKFTAIDVNVVFSFFIQFFLSCTSFLKLFIL